MGNDKMFPKSILSFPMTIHASLASCFGARVASSGFGHSWSSGEGSWRGWSLRSELSHVAMPLSLPSKADIVFQGIDYYSLESGCNSRRSPGLGPTWRLASLHVQLKTYVEFLGLQSQPITL